MIASSIWNLKFCLAPSVVHILVQQWHLKKNKTTTPQWFAHVTHTVCSIRKQHACLSVLIISVELLLTVSTASSHYLRPVFWWSETLFNTLFSTTDVMPMSVASLCIQHKEYIKYARNVANGKCTTRIICDIIFVFFFYYVLHVNNSKWLIITSSNSEIVCSLRVRSLLCLLSWFVWR